MKDQEINKRDWAAKHERASESRQLSKNETTLDARGVDDSYAIIYGELLGARWKEKFSRLIREETAIEIATQRDLGGCGISRMNDFRCNVSND